MKQVIQAIALLLFLVALPSHAIIDNVLAWKENNKIEEAQKTRTSNKQWQTVTSQDPASDETYVTEAYVRSDDGLCYLAVNNFFTTPSSIRIGCPDIKLSTSILDREIPVKASGSRKATSFRFNNYEGKFFYISYYNAEERIEYYRKPIENKPFNRLLSMIIESNQLAVAVTTELGNNLRLRFSMSGSAAAIQQLEIED